MPRLVAINILATLRDHLGGLDRVTGVVKLLGLVNATPDFERHPFVIDGASTAAWPTSSAPSGDPCPLGVRRRLACPTTSPWRSRPSSRSEIDMNQGDDETGRNWHVGPGTTPTAAAALINVSGTMTSLGASITGEAGAPGDRRGHGRVRQHARAAGAGERRDRRSDRRGGRLHDRLGRRRHHALGRRLHDRPRSRAASRPCRTIPARRMRWSSSSAICAATARRSSQAIELAGATVRPVGQSTQAADYQLEAALTEKTAAALYVVSHHVVALRPDPAAPFCRDLPARQGVPVIVDAASEYDLTGFLADGADLVDLFRATSSLAGRPRASSPASAIWCAPPTCRTWASAAA